VREPARTRPIAAALALALTLGACAESHELGDDAGPISCSGLSGLAGLGGSCSAGCMAITLWAIREDRGCVGPDPSVIVACLPDGATFSGGGPVACFARAGSSTRVWSPLGSIRDEDGVDLLRSAGWTTSPCENLATGERLVMPCPL
jgi:hypothetical protein